MNSNEWIDMNESKRMNWNEWIGMNELSTSSSKSGPSPSVFDVFYVKSSADYSLVHILSTSSSKSGASPLVLTIFMLYQLDDDVWSTDEMKLSL